MSCSAPCITHGVKDRFCHCICTLHGVTQRISYHERVDGSLAWCITRRVKDQFCNHVHIDGSSAWSDTEDQSSCEHRCFVGLVHNACSEGSLLSLYLHTACSEAPGQPSCARRLFLRLVHKACSEESVLQMLGGSTIVFAQCVE